MVVTHWTRWLAFLFCSTICVTATASAQPAPTENTERIGRIAFPVTARPAAQEHIERGLAWLHSFGYEDAFEEFEQAFKIDPTAAMAVWGESMTFSQPVWGTEDLTRGRLALSQLGPTSSVRLARARTTRERRYLEAVEILYGDADKPARARAYADAMGRLAADFPDDTEATVLHALALLGTVHRGDDPDSLESPSGPMTHALVGSETQTRVADMLSRVLVAHPEHPGALHYLIHALDDPAHARAALNAARTYATVAPSSSHALHMPAHIFLQLGMWDDAVRSDRASFEASVRRVAKRGLTLADRDYHSLSWLQYEYLQQGRYREARQTFDQIQPAADQTGQPRIRNVLGHMRAHWGIETRRWDDTRRQETYFNVDELFAIGLSAARAGDQARAEVTSDRLAAVAASGKLPGLMPLIRIMEHELAGLVQRGRGRTDEALSELKTAVELQEALPPPVGWPQPLKPAHELYGEVLFENGQPGEAAAQFRKALARSPNRSLAVLGLARAEAAAGRADEARAGYEAFLKNWEHADAELPELNEARAFLAGQVTDSRSGLGRNALILAVVLGLGVAALIVVRRRRTVPGSQGRMVAESRTRPGKRR